MYNIPTKLDTLCSKGLRIYDLSEIYGIGLSLTLTHKRLISYLLHYLDLVFYYVL